MPSVAVVGGGLAHRFGVHDKVRLDTEVQRATFDEAANRWRIETTAGTHEADVLVTACGQLSTPSVPAIPGLDRFPGPVFHTARWRHDVDLTGRRVALVGSGCSAVQVGPAIQPEVAQLDVDQLSHDFVAPMEIAGRGGRTLAETWSDVARAYLGVTVPGFPNLFLL